MTVVEIEDKTRAIIAKETQIAKFTREEWMIWSAKLQYNAYHHNFDWGYEELYKIVDDSRCDNHPF
jgi:hypothetical protein